MTGVSSESIHSANSSRKSSLSQGDLVKFPPVQAEKSNKVKSWLRTQKRKTCSKAFLQRKIPITQWLPTYTFNFLIHDIVAGLTVGLTAIPQGIANAVIAGLDPQYGLYSGFMGSFTYIIFGSCKDITIGPTAILALMTQEHVEEFGPDFAILLCFISGCIILLLGLLNLGFLVDFISVPVTAGFTSAAAVTIASAQVKGLLGLKGNSNEFLESWKGIFDRIGETQKWDVVLGVSTIVLLVLLKELNKLQRKGENLTKGQKIFNKAIWLISLGRNAIIVIVAAGMAYAFKQNGEPPFRLTGDIKDGLPPLEPPPFSTVHNNRTYEFGDMTKELGTSLITVPLIAVLESIAIAKAFSKGKSLDATQEMIALGLCNIAGSFTRSMPITGSFTRTAVNNASGVKTPLGGLFTGVLVLLALGLLTKAFDYIPKASLAGIIIAAMIFMVEYELVPLLWRTRKLDLLLMVITFLCCLFISLEYGILIGIVANIFYILYDAARPKVTIVEMQVMYQDVLLVTPSQSLMFPSAEYVREQIMKNCIALDSTATVIVEGGHIRYIDVTMAKVLQHLQQDLKSRNQNLFFWNWNRSVKETCVNMDPKMIKLFRNDEKLEQLFLGTISKDESQSVPEIQVSEVP